MFATGGDGITFVSMGFYPLSLVTLIYYIKILEGKSKLWMIPIYAVILHFLYLPYLYIYRDGPFVQLTTQVQYGPYKNLYTTPLKKEYIDEVKRQLDIVQHGPKKPNGILFAYIFSGGYIMSDIPPLVSSTWLVPQVTHTFLEHFFNTHQRHIPDVIFVMKQVPYGDRMWMAPEGALPIHTFLKKNPYKKIYNSINFSVYQTTSIKRP
jgi:hypothetical protein